MRIISQDGMVDFPYENIAISTGHRGDNKEFYIFANFVNCAEQKPQILARYSTEKKAEKAMEMLHDNYGRLCNVKVLASGSAKHMEESFPGNKLNEIIEEYQEMNIFRFPADGDVEV